MNAYIESPTFLNITIEHYAKVNLIFFHISISNAFTEMNRTQEIRPPIAETHGNFCNTQSFSAMYCTSFINLKKKGGGTVIGMFCWRCLKHLSGFTARVILHF